MAATLGGVAGAFAALIRNFNHGHPDLTPAEQAQHFAPEAVGVALASAVLGAIIAIVRNRLKKR